jgi:hypothetical protein
MHFMQDNRDQIARGAREVPVRVVIDVQGNEWVVHEVDTPQPWAHGVRCLIFSSPAIVRRVWRYPAGWARLSARELLDLLDDTSHT